MIKLVLAEADSERAWSFYEACLEAGERLVAPHLLASEVTNALRQRMRAGQQALSLEQAFELLEQFVAFDIELLSTPAVYRHALRLAEAYNLSAAYDAQYLALASLLDITFWTADERLFNAVKNHISLIRRVADYSAGTAL